MDCAENVQFWMPIGDGVSLESLNCMDTIQLPTFLTIYRNFWRDNGMFSYWYGCTRSERRRGAIWTQVLIGFMKKARISILLYLWLSFA